MLPDEIRKHIKALEQWLEQLEQIPKPPAGLSAEERKQLHTVNKAVDQLQRAGVSVPKDLRSLKLKLSAKDFTGIQNQEAETQLKIIEKFINALNKTTKSARVVRDKLKSKGQIRATKNTMGFRCWISYKPAPCPPMTIWSCNGSRMVPCSMVK
jgi:hypothetical protein